MEEAKVNRLREKLGISAKDQKAAEGKAINRNLRQKIATVPESGGNFISASGSGGNFLSAPGSGGNFLSAIGG